MRALDLDGHRDPEGVVNHVWSTMLFPESPDRAFEYFARAEIGRSAIMDLPNDGEVTLPAAWIKALVNGDSLPSTEAKAATSKRQGVTAGILLTSAHLYSMTGRPVTLNGAIEAMVIAIAKSEFPPNWTQPYKNKGEIHAAWKNMQSVAHLWAALTSVETSIASATLAPSVAALETMLGIASAYLRWAANSAVPGADPGTQQMLMNQDTAWRLPPRFDGPPLPDLAMDQLPWSVVAAARAKRGQTG